MSEEIKDIIEILELAKEDIENNNENITATLDLQDLKSLKKLLDLYQKEKEKNDKIKTLLEQGKTTINFSEEKLKKLSEEIGYLIGSEGTVEQAELFEIMLKDYNTRIEFIKNIQELLEERK